MTNNTIPNVPRELLERAVRIPTKASVEENHAAIVDRGRAQSELRALLSAPSPAGVAGLDVVAWRIGFPNNAGYKVYEQRQPWAYEQYGVPSVIVYEVQELCRLSAAKAIIYGLRGEVERLQFSLEVAKTDELSAAVYAETESIKHSLWDAEKERDQQAQRLGELEGLLRDSAELIKHGVFEDGYCCCGSSVDSHGLGDGHSPVDALAYHAGQVCERIDAALSAGKDRE